MPVAIDGNEAALPHERARSSPRDRQTRSTSYDDENTYPEEKMYPKEDVFSYFSLAAPNEYKRNGIFTLDASMSYLLAVATVIIQAVLVYVVYNNVVVQNSEWQHGIMNLGGAKIQKLKEGEDWSVFDEHSASQCNSGQSLCSLFNGTFSCAPPSVQLTGRWDELDTNKDGVWTREEVIKERDRLKCKYVADPLEIFDMYVHLLQERKHIIWLHPDILSGKAIPKPYFTFAMGDIVMCGYRNEDMCGNLLKRGVFDVPLKEGKSPRVGTTINSAMQYCRGMLQPRGTCEVLLPSTYSTWKIESVAQCKMPKYKQFTYNHPKNGNVKSLLEVDYKARQRFARAKTTLFKVYKGFLVGFWMLLIISALREVWLTFAWINGFPTEEIDLQEAFSKSLAIDSSKRLRHGTMSSETGIEEPVTGITTPHRIALYIVNIGRAVVLSILLFVGLSFLGRNTDYIGLLLDGVALVWIVEIAEILYAKVIRVEVRNTWMSSKPLSIRPWKAMPLTVTPEHSDWIWLTITIVFCVLYIVWYSSVVVEPLYDALECSCVQEGPHCREATVFSKSFWDHYWRHDVPDSFAQIDALKQSQSAEAVGSLLRHRHRHHHAHLGQFR
mmetsp:Transcript_106750/g.166734  ORF Transcript_106750/g.166734 Transcript_106750/m.166734 type:complete len:611 (-) Transcript_106750:98-1930(-)